MLEARSYKFLVNAETIGFLDPISAKFEKIDVLKSLSLSYECLKSFYNYFRRKLNEFEP